MLILSIASLFLISKFKIINIHLPNQFISITNSKVIKQNQNELESADREFALWLSFVFDVGNMGEMEIIWCEWYFKYSVLV